MGSFFVLYVVVESAQLVALLLIGLNVALHRRMIHYLRDHVDYSCWVREDKPVPFTQWRESRRRDLIEIKRKDAA